MEQEINQLNEKIDKMQKQIDELMKHKQEKTRQQLSFPVDETTKKIIQDITA